MWEPKFNSQKYNKVMKYNKIKYLFVSIYGTDFATKLLRVS